MKDWKVVAALAASTGISALLGSCASALLPWGRVLGLVGSALLGGAVGFLTWKRLEEQHQKESLVDEGAGVCSWEFLARVLQLQVSCSRRYGQPTSVLVVQVGNNVSPEFRDEVTAQVARHLQNMCRNTDLIARSGDDKVVALLTWTPEEPVFELAHRILTSLQTLGYGPGRLGIGFACWQSGYSPETLLERAYSCAQHSLDLDGLRVVCPAGPQQVPVPHQI